MEEALHSLGVDWKLLLSQIVNFFILLFLLYKFLYKPVLKMLTEREEKIAKSLKQCEEIETNLKCSTEEKEKIVNEARKEAAKIIEEARLSGEEAKRKLLLETVQE